MTIFAKRDLNVTQWAAIQDQIAALQLALRAPHDLMMLSADKTPTLQTIILGLPSDTLLAAFPGFEAIKREAIPDYLAALVVREDGFAERFPDIAAKRRIRLVSQNAER
jgi:hypothetical protein